MDRSFLVEILTPERVFYTGNLESLSIETPDGRLTVMAGHIPMVCLLSAGQLVLKENGAEKTAFHSSGFMDVTRDYVVVLCQACEWPEEIDAGRAQEAAQRASGRLGQAPDDADGGKSAILRARSRLRVREYFDNKADS